jgi:hypothetical protein
MEALGSTQVVPQAEWGAFFDSFSRVHAGWLCTMEVLGESIGAQVETQGMRLAGVSADVGHDAPKIYLTMEQGDAHLTHVVSSPRQVRLKLTAEGADEALEIDGGDLRTLLTFRVPVLPETVDGVVDE